MFVKYLKLDRKPEFHIQRGEIDVISSYLEIQYACYQKKEIQYALYEQLTRT